MKKYLAEGLVIFASIFAPFSVENIRQDLDNIRKNNVETTKRSNIALNHLNEKIDLK